MSFASTIHAVAVALPIPPTVLTTPGAGSRGVGIWVGTGTRFQMPPCSRPPSFALRCPQDDGPSANCFTVWEFEVGGRGGPFNLIGSWPGEAHTTIENFGSSQNSVGTGPREGDSKLV